MRLLSLKGKNRLETVCAWRKVARAPFYIEEEAYLERGFPFLARSSELL
jgi:hypothetical protein